MIDQTDIVGAPALRHLNAKQVALKLSVSPATVRRWARDRKPGFPQPLRSGLYREFEIDRFVADSRLRPGPRWEPIA